MKKLIHKLFGEPVWVQKDTYTYKGRLHRNREGRITLSYTIESGNWSSESFGTPSETLTWWPR